MRASADIYSAAGGETTRPVLAGVSRVVGEEVQAATAAHCGAGPARSTSDTGTPPMERGMNERRLLIVMTAGFGDVRRWTKLGAALTAAIPQVSGTKALPLMHSANLGAFVLRTDCAKSPVEVGLALINALPGGLFEYGEGLSNPDRLLVAELGAEPWATDVVLKTAAGMR